MSGVNYAEVQARLDRGDFTLAECHRHGANHRAYEWAYNPPPQFDETQQDAYRKGYKGVAL
jgi:hypothetical protein